MIDLSPKCYIPSFVEFGPLVPDKTKFDEMFTIYGHGSHLGYVSFPISLEASHKIWLRLAKRFLRRCLIIVNYDGPTTNGRRSMGIL